MKQQGWSAGRIALVLFPFAAGAVGVNVFFATLIGSWLGWPILSTNWSMAIGCIIGIPASIAFAHHIRGLMDKANQSENT